MRNTLPLVRHVIGENTIDGPRHLYGVLRQSQLSGFLNVPIFFQELPPRQVNFVNMLLINLSQIFIPVTASFSLFSRALTITKDGETVVERVQLSGFKDNIKYADFIKPAPAQKYQKSPEGNLNIKPRQRGQYAQNVVARKPLTTTDTTSEPPTSTVNIEALYKAVRLAHKLEEMSHRKRPNHVIQGNYNDGTSYTTTEIPQDPIRTPVPETVDFAMPPGK